MIFDKDVPYERWNSAKLAEKVRQLEEAIQQKESTLDDQMSQNIRTRRQAEHLAKTIVVRDKPKGKIDEVGKQRIWEMAKHTMLSNVLSSAMWIPAALAAHEFTIFLLLQNVTNALLQPLQMAIQKRQEVH